MGMIKRGEESAAKARAETQYKAAYKFIPALPHQGKERPKKRLYRARAHSNPLNDAHFPVPSSPEAVDWAALYPERFASDGNAAETETPVVRFADVGCGFGGLLIRLSPLYPDKLMIGFELRDKVAEYVRERILALRRENAGQYENVACLRTNAMKFLPHYFRKGQLEKLFFLFPDPHFKAVNHRRRIIQHGLLTEYAHFLAIGGIIYTITDVKELGDWMQEKLNAHPLFEAISDEELEQDPAAGLLVEGTEEGQKVARNQGQTFRACFRRVPGPSEQ